MNRTVPTDRVVQKLDEYLSKNDYAAAKTHLLYWLSEAESVGDGRAALLINNELMGLCRKLGEKNEALSFAKSALDLVEKMSIQNNIGAATTYLNSATVYKAFGMADSAIPLFEKAQMIYEQNLLPSDDRLGGLYNNMALAFVDLRRFEEADSLYKKAISVMQNKQPEQAITYLNMASAAEAQFGLEGAEQMISALVQKAMELLDNCKNQTDGNYAFVCEKCATVFGYYGYFAYENELKERCRRIYEGT
ncbi:MAG: tetratricopeptide repeat protein [Oscillospiraceae bacterium]|nr:tetratricopeptide repeat protein [Oscillospiraceae bacterium]